MHDIQPSTSNTDKETKNDDEPKTIEEETKKETKKESDDSDSVDHDEPQQKSNRTDSDSEEEEAASAAGVKDELAAAAAPVADAAAAAAAVLASSAAPDEDVEMEDEVEAEDDRKQQSAPTTESEAEKKKLEAASAAPTDDKEEENNDKNKNDNDKNNDNDDDDDDGGVRPMETEEINENDVGGEKKPENDDERNADDDDAASSSYGKKQSDDGGENINDNNEADENMKDPSVSNSGDDKPAAATSSAAPFNASPLAETAVDATTAATPAASTSTNGAAATTTTTMNGGDDEGNNKSFENASIASNAAAAAAAAATPTSGDEKEQRSKAPNNGDHKSNISTKKDTASPSAAAAAAAASSTQQPPAPVMRGTLSYNVESRKHIIRGMWNYENSNLFPAQRFDLQRTCDATQDVKQLPCDGTFSGSFSLAYLHTTSKGRQKERSKVIPESGVLIKFIPLGADQPGEYKVEGKGTNQFGVFHLNGTAKPSDHEGDGEMKVEFRKRYEPSPPVVVGNNNNATAAAVAAMSNAASENGSGKLFKKRNSNDGDHAGGGGGAGVFDPDSLVAAGPLPEPSKSFPTGVVCLRGQLYKEESRDLGLTEVVHRIHGLWAQGLDYILADPQNTRGLLSRFEYVHKSMVPTQEFPVSGKYSGWFDLISEDGTSTTTINERDVTLKFKKNSAGYHNIEGKGSNVFGRYSITGTLTLDNVITIFRQFLPRKIKTKSISTAATAVGGGGGAATTVGADGSITAAPPPLHTPSGGSLPGGDAASRRHSASGLANLPDPPLKLDDVIVPGTAASATTATADDSGNGELLKPIEPPANATYSAVSRGILRQQEDGSHQCNGKWAVTREHLTNNQTSNFTFRLEDHFVKEAIQQAATAATSSSNENGKGDTSTEARQFPLDSAMYKGSFQLKKSGTRYQTIVDQQVAMKFRKNTAGSYNVYGRGVNAIGIFNLLGTLVMSGKTGGQVELYRMYPPELLASNTAPAPVITGSSANAAAPKASGGGAAMAVVSSAAASSVADAGAASKGSTPVFPGPLTSSLQRRESTRLVKLPSRLEDDDPSAQLNRMMDRCEQILRIMREKDVERGAFFSEPVDPVALGIPTYNQIITEPMDLRTVHRRMESHEVDDPEEFARLVRLVFQNAMKFTADPAHSVHQVARDLLVFFNQRFRDVERMLQNIRKVQDGDVTDKTKKGTAAVAPDGKKRKKEEKPKSRRERRLEEAQTMATEHSRMVAAIVAAAPPTSSPTISRSEFNLLLRMIEQMQSQMVKTHTLLAELSDGGDGAGGGVASATTTTNTTTSSKAASSKSSKTSTTGSSAPPPEKKKAVKRKIEAVAPDEAPVRALAVNDDNTPLTMEEQELLTETINELPPEHLDAVAQIIREAAPVGANDDEIDLEIDDLDISTQRKLLRHVSKFVKKSKVGRMKKAKISNAQPKKTKATPAAKAKPQAKARPKAASSPAATPTPEKPADRLFSFPDSDSDSEDEVSVPAKPVAPPAPASAAAAATTITGNTQGINKAPAPGGKEFKFGLDGVDDDDDDDDDDELGSGGFATSWNVSKPAGEADKREAGEEEDTAWASAARTEAAQAKAREAERKAREEKLKAEAENAKNQRLADAAKRAEEVRLLRIEEEAKEAELKKQEEEEAEKARQEARKAARAQVESVEQTVDFEAQRDLMKQYEQTYLDKDLGSASPSSDFGF